MIKSNSKGKKRSLGGKSKDCDDKDCKDCRNPLC